MKRYCMILYSSRLPRARRKTVRFVEGVLQWAFLKIYEAYVWGL